MSKSVFDKIKNEDFKELVLIAKKYKKELNAKHLYKQWLVGSPNVEALINKWLLSLENNSPDFSIYCDDAYLNDVFACWKNFSRKNLILIKRYFENKNKQKIKYVLDMGCGIGYTTLALSEIFPEAIIYGENLKDTLQYSVMKEVSANNKNIKIVDEKSFLTKVPKVDILICFEFFEHLQEPIDMMITLLEKYMPKYFIFANSFTTLHAAGHFSVYYYNGEEYTGKEISRLFNKIAKEKFGYVEVKTGFWNNRPKIYKKLVKKGDKNV